MLRFTKPIKKKMQELYSPKKLNNSKEGLPEGTQLILLQEIERSGGISAIKNKSGKKKQLQEPLLDKHPALFGIRGDHRRLQARWIFDYWWTIYLKGKYNDLLLRYEAKHKVSFKVHPISRSPSSR
jgi:hypothetical protein